MLDPATGRVTFLDLGLMGELRQEQRLDLIALVWALRMEDPGMLAVVVRRLCRATGPVDEAAFRAAIERIFYRAWVYGKGSFSGVMASLFSVLGEHHLQMRRELVLAIKAITQAEQLVSAIQPGLPLVRGHRRGSPGRSSRRSSARSWRRSGRARSRTCSWASSARRRRLATRSCRTSSRPS